uniref:Tetraspanin n=2 Tax=Denticeps clupeoides TaxID=299321 RepID=A0AAY4DR92_9TELE
IKMSCLKCLKYTMCGANFLFFMCGVAIFGFGISLMTKTKVAGLLPSLAFMSVANILFITGIIITCISFLGFLGALKENRCLLISFFILLFIVMLAELAGACILLVYESDIDKRIAADLRTSLKQSIDSRNNTVVKEDDWDLLQQTFECCGIENKTDWEGNIPSSCYVNKLSTDKLFDKGCYNLMKEWFESNLLSTGIGVIVLCSIEVLGMCFSMTLFCHISRSGLGYK